MKIYILKAYPTPHKWESDALIIGYFTNKAKLYKAIRSHANDLDIIDLEEFNRAFYYRVSRELEWSIENDYSVCRWLATGTVEVVEANQIL